MTDRSNIEDLLLLWEDSLTQGKELSPEQLCADRPDMLPQIRLRIQAIKAMHWMEEEGEPETPAIVPELPKSLGRYRLEQQIGTGGFGEVWKAYDPHLARYVAIKLPRSDRVTPRDLDAFLAEARRVASLRHPGIVPVFDVGQSDGRWFIVSEFVDGTDLAHTIESRHLSPEESARLIADVASYLHYAHQQGFVHRDLKPSNILLDRHGKPYLADFGIAASLREVDLSARRQFGTLPYMPPEAISDEPDQLDPKADIYGLGVVFYELLAGRLPFDADSTGELRNQILHSDPPPLKTICRDVPDELQVICLKCLAKMPADRYLTADDLAQSLRSWLAKRPRPSRMPLAALAVVVALAVAITVPVLTRHRLSGDTPARDSATDCYRLAQECERMGQVREAQSAYERCLAMNEELVEPPLAYLRLLQSNMEREAAARQFEATCRPFAGNAVYDLAALRLLDGEPRRLALERFKDEHPTFALAYFDLADCYSAEEMPNRSRIAESREQVCLKQAILLTEQQEFAQYFIDKGLAARRLDDARRRLSASTNAPHLANMEPVQFHAPGLIYIVDPCVAKVLYSVDEKSWQEAEEFRILGRATFWASAGIKRADMQCLTEAARAGKAKLLVKYVDKRGLESNPFPFTPDASQLTRFVIRKIELPKIEMPDFSGLPKADRERLRDVEKVFNSPPETIYIPMREQ